MPELVNTIDLFDNAVGDHEIKDPDEIVFLENIIDVLQGKETKLVDDLVTLTVFTPDVYGNDNDKASTTINVCHRMSRIASDWKLHSSNTPIGHPLTEVSNDIHNKINQKQTEPNINNLYHQNIALPSKMKKR